MVKVNIRMVNEADIWKPKEEQELWNRDDYSGINAGLLVIQAPIAKTRKQAIPMNTCYFKSNFKHGGLLQFSKVVEEIIIFSQLGMKN